MHLRQVESGTGDGVTVLEAASALQGGATLRQTAIRVPFLGQEQAQAKGSGKDQLMPEQAKTPAELAQAQKALMEATEADWDRILGVNLKGVAFSCKAVLPKMIEQKSGAIVLIGSTTAISRPSASYTY